MKNRPAWCAPTKYNGAKGRIENLIPGFRAAKCQGKKNATKEPCKNIAVTGSCYCWQHGGAKGLAARAKAINPKLVPVTKSGSAKRRYCYAVTYAQDEQKL